MDVSSVMVQQMYQQVNSTVSMLKQSANSGQTAVQLVGQAVNMAEESNKTATRGQNIDILV